MTANTILVRRGRVFSAAEIEGIMAVARDPFCPDVMDLFTVEAAAKYGRENAELLEKAVGKLIVPVEGSFHVTWGSPETEEDDLMAAVRAVARGE